MPSLSPEVWKLSPLSACNARSEYLLVVTRSLQLSTRNVSKMSLAHFATGAFLIVCLMGAAWAAPTTPSSGSQSNIEPDSQTNDELPEIKATTENKSSESGVELTSEFPEDVKCRYAWQKFLVDFNVQYESYAESQKRRKIFCANWQRIQEHNAQYELGKVSHKKSINQWADLTFEEWKNKQRPILAPAFAKVKPTTNSTEVEQTRIKCQGAWEKFLTDFGSKYQNVTETEKEKRRSIFCDNWQGIQEHNAQYELGKVSHKKSINQWSDLTFEEWKKLQEPSFQPNTEEPGTYTTIPPNMDLPGNKTNSTEVKGESPGSNQYWFNPNMEEPGTYVLQTPTNSNPPNMELPGNKTEASEVDPKKIQCQAAWEKFLTDFGLKYQNETGTETEKRHNIFCDNWQRIQEHNALYELGKVTHMKAINQWSDLTFEEWMKLQEPSFQPNTEEPGTYTTIPPNMDLPGNKTNSTEVKGDSPGSNQYWFSPNMEEPGTYLKPEELTHEVSRIEAKKEPPKIDLSTERSFEPPESAPSPNLKLSGNKTEEEDINSGYKEWLKRQKEQNRFPPSLEEETSTKSKPLKEELADKVRGIEDKEQPPKMEASQESASSPNLKLSGNIREVEEVNEQDMDSGVKEWLKRQEEQNRFPPNLEEAGTYIAE